MRLSARDVRGPWRARWRVEWGLGALRYFEILKRPASMDSLGKSIGVGCHALPRALPNPGIKPASLMSPALAGRFFTASATWKAYPLYVQFSTCRQSRVRLSVTPWTIAHQAPLSMEFSRQEYLSGLPFLTCKCLQIRIHIF